MALVSLVSHNWHLLEETVCGLEAAQMYSNVQGIETDLAVSLSMQVFGLWLNIQQVLCKWMLMLLSCSPAAFL